MTDLILEWQNTLAAGGRLYTCGYCGAETAPDKGYVAATGAGNLQGRILICPRCRKPTFFTPDGEQTPRPRPGRTVNGVTDESVARIYEEARDAAGAAAYTGAVLLCRKILMNLAVRHGAKEKLTFEDYVDFLDQDHWVPPNGRAWVDQIRKQGNEATHQLSQKTKQEAEQMLTFVEMLLRFSFEFPSMVAPKAE